MTADAVVRAVPADRRLSLSTKLFYGFGSVAFGVKDNGFSYLLLLFYNQVIGLPVTLVGLAAMIALLWDACIDPLIGQLSDNLHSRWGRRHPFMYAAALPVALCYMALWNPPHWSHQALFFYLIVTAIVIRTFISFYEVPSSALAAEFSANYDERSELLSYRFFFAWVGGLALNFIAFFFLFTPDRTHKVGQLNPVGYAHYGMVGAAVMFVAILISAAGTHRHIPTLMQPPPRRRLTLRKTVGEMAETLSNRSFVFLLLSGIAMAMARGSWGVAEQLHFNTFSAGVLRPDRSRSSPPVSSSRRSSLPARRAAAVAPLRRPARDRHRVDGAVADGRVDAAVAATGESDAAEPLHRPGGDHLLHLDHRHRPWHHRLDDALVHDRRRRGGGRTQDRTAFGRPVLRRLDVRRQVGLRLPGFLQRR